MSDFDIELARMEKDAEKPPENLLNERRREVDAIGKDLVRQSQSLLWLFFAIFICWFILQVLQSYQGTLHTKPQIKAEATIEERL